MNNISICFLHYRRPFPLQRLPLTPFSETQGQSVGSESFQVRAKEPLGIDSHRAISKNSSGCGSWLGTKNALYYCAQSAKNFSLVLFVSSYTTAIVSITACLTHAPKKCTQSRSESRYPGALSPVLENFRRALSPDPTDCPWVSEDALTRALEGFICVCWNLSFRGRQSAVSMAVLTRSNREGSLVAERRAKIYQNHRMTTVFLIISVRWRITLLKQRGLCELSEIAKTLCIVYVKVFRLFIYLIVWKHGSRGRIAKE